MHFLVIIRMRDPKDPETQRRREEARPAHLENAERYQEAGHLLLGGAILDDEGNAAGSAAVADFETREDLEAWLKSDPYTLADVWQDFEILPFRVAPHYKLGAR